MAKSKSLVGKIALIHWKDAWNQNGRYARPEDLVTEPDYCLKSVGWVLLDNKDGVTFAVEQLQDDTRYRHIHHVCRDMILSIKELK